MKFSVIIAPRADEDLRAITSWIAQDSPANAEQWLDDVLSAIDTLSTFPERFTLAREHGRHVVPLRNLSLGNYRVIFTISEGAVRVLHVRHAAREDADPGTL